MDDNKFKELMETLDAVIDDAVSLSPQIFKKSDRNEIRVMSYAMGVSVTVGMAIGGLDKNSDPTNSAKFVMLKMRVQEVVNKAIGE